MDSSNNETKGRENIRKTVKEIIEPFISHVKGKRKRKTMPYKEIDALIKMLFPKTRHIDRKGGFYKQVFFVHSNKRVFALKIGRNRKDIRKDYITYLRISKDAGHRYFAKIYWREGVFLLQKYGKKAKIPMGELIKLKSIGKKYGLKDIKKDNVLKFGNKFKIIDAERR